MNTELIFRVVSISVLLTTLGISGYFRKLARRKVAVLARRSEGTLALVARCAGGLTLLVALLIFPLDPDWLEWSRIPIPNWLRWVGAFLACLCPLLIIWVFRSIGPNISETVLTRSTHNLVTIGPYRWIRHPLYAVSLLLILALALLASSGLLLTLLLLTFALVRFLIIPIEERNLIAKFGMAYRDYRSRTGALVPWLRA